MLKAAKDSYNASDLTNFKIQSPNPNIGMIDARAALESLTDSAGLLLNNLRHYLDKQFSADDVKPAQRILSVARGSVKLSKDHHAAIKEERYIPHASHA